MKVLAIESSGLVASVAVLEDERLIAEYTVDYKKTHSQTLLPMLEEIKKNIELDMDSIDVIAVSNGPGSFTGLRIGSATAKGLAYALNKPMVEVPTLASLAYGYYGTDKIICPIMDARREEVYTAVYKFASSESTPMEYRLQSLIDPVPMPISELVEKLNEIGTQYNEKIIFVGDGIDVYKNTIADKLNIEYSFGWAGMNRQRASSVAALGLQLYREGKAVSSLDSHPIYLRLSQAERERIEKNSEKN